MHDRELPPQCPDQVCGPSSHLLNDYLGLFPAEDSGWDTKLVIYLHPVTKLRTCGATTSFSLSSDSIVLNQTRGLFQNWWFLEPPTQRKIYITCGNRNVGLTGNNSKKMYKLYVRLRRKAGKSEWKRFRERNWRMWEYNIRMNQINMVTGSGSGFIWLRIRTCCWLTWRH